MTPRLSLSAAALTVTLLAACGGSTDDASTTTPTSSSSTQASSTTSTPSSTTTASPSTPEPIPSTVTPEVDPTVPSEARQHDKAGVATFADHYWEQLVAATLTGDTTVLADLSTDACQVCTAYVDEIARRDAAGLLLEEAPYTYTPRAPDRSLMDEGGDYGGVDVTTDGYELPEGGEVEQIDVGVNLGLERVESGWRVASMTIFFYERDQDTTADPLIRTSIEQGQGMYLQR